MCPVRTLLTVREPLLRSHVVDLVAPPVSRAAKLDAAASGVLNSTWKYLAGYERLNAFYVIARSRSSHDHMTLVVGWVVLFRWTFRAE
jgi:hypothetical protein